MITPMDIHNKTFSKQIRGYSSEEVNSFLEELAGDYERIYREHREMEERDGRHQDKAPQLGKDGRNHVQHPRHGSADR